MPSQAWPMESRCRALGATSSGTWLAPLHPAGVGAVLGDELFLPPKSTGTWIYPCKDDGQVTLKAQEPRAARWGQVGGWDWHCPRQACWSCDVDSGGAAWREALLRVGGGPSSTLLRVLIPKTDMKVKGLFGGQGRPPSTQPCRPTTGRDAFAFSKRHMEELQRFFLRILYKGGKFPGHTNTCQPCGVPWSLCLRTAPPLQAHTPTQPHWPLLLLGHSAPIAGLLLVHETAPVPSDLQFPGFLQDRTATSCSPGPLLQWGIPEGPARVSNGFKKKLFLTLRPVHPAWTVTLSLIPGLLCPTANPWVSSLLNRPQ